MAFPVIDLFAGPGGLGEGFASMPSPSDKRKYAFTEAISIEKDVFSHQTLQLRHFFRQFFLGEAPEDYYQYLAGDISLEQLYSNYPIESRQAKQSAWLCTLGEQPHPNVYNKIADSLSNRSKWVLIGGPPCQAYSLVGRSRMSNMPDFEADPRHFLYREYLRVIADHKPPVFVMENVKGLLSAKVKGEHVINLILNDLSTPERAIYQLDGGVRYKLYSLADHGLKNADADPKSFIIKAEEYGIPQARHRMFIVGVREDLDIRPSTLMKSASPSVRQIIGLMPPVRSGLSKSTDSFMAWQDVLKNILEQSWFIKGKTNGRAELTHQACKYIEQLKHMELEKSTIRYSAPEALRSWLHDPRLETLTSHEARSHMNSDIQRYFFAALHADIHGFSPKISDFPESLLPDHRNIGLAKEGKMFSDRFRVQLPDSPATTITSHISKDGHYFIHYDPMQCRSLTVREAARLQTFPDNYKFEGPRTSQYHQVGNAVPPLLAAKIAEIIHDLLERAGDI